ncbi:MAG: branched-chain amino acid ABC transporter permease [Spirochaetes bacterium]|nr:branched-chain amino acid ABC transporter permease [Spirochaetota bacterium]
MEILTLLKSNKTLRTATIVVLILLILATLPIYTPDYTIVLLSSILMYVVLTVSWVLFSGPTGYISLAPAAFIGVGIYSTAILGDSMPFPVVVLVSGIVTIFIALLVGALTLRLKGIYFTIFTFGLLELIRHLVLFLELHLTGTRGRFVIAQDFITVYFYMLIILAVLLLVTFLINRSKYGLALRSIGQNEEAASHIGVNVTTVKIATFVISAFFMGAAGAVMATRWTYIDPGIAFNMFFSFMPVMMALFGGMAHLYGPIIGSVVFTYLEEFLLTKLPELYMMLFGAIFIVAILYLPDGLLGVIQKGWAALMRKVRKDNLGGNHANS